MANANTKPDYGIDAPGVLRGLFLSGAACLLIYASLRSHGHTTFDLGAGPTNIHFDMGPMLVGTGTLLLLESFLFVIYVKYGKFRHRDAMLAMHPWTGAEQVLDVGCGRGLLLVGAAKRISSDTGHATGIDIWSNVDMGQNSAARTQRNIDLENVTDRCTLISMPAQTMTFPDASFDLVVSNLCIHNIKKQSDRDQACREIVRVLKPGGQALISDYKGTASYARVFLDANCEVSRKWGSWLTTFPPLRTVIVRKPGPTI
jgi:arsenite methyltransferase